MTPIGRSLVGILTTIIFMIVGISILEDVPRLGWFVIALAVLRGGYAIWQFVVGVRSPLGQSVDDDEPA
ncbi:MAG: hypothetical protein AAF211_22285 [Myxococcota bacterium]